MNHSLTFYSVSSVLERSERYEGSSNKKCAANLVTANDTGGHLGRVIMSCYMDDLFLLNVYEVHFAEAIVKINVYDMFFLC